MAEEDIGVLGESLLARTKQRNDDLYKRSKKDAYKMGLVAAGTGLIKQNLVNQTQNFLGREDIMAARARQAQGYRDAQFILQQKDEIDASGLNPLEYFTKQVRPELTARANLELNESRVDPDSYGLYVQSEARKLAQQRLDAFNKALEAAQGVQSPEDFDAFAQLKTQRNATIGGWVANAARKAFGGKSQSELDQDMVDSIVDSGILEKATAVTSLRNIYSQTGDIELAIDAAALASLPEVDSAIAKTEVGDVVEVTGPWGGTMQVQLENHYDATGSLIKQTERVIRGGVDVSTSNNPELSQISAALKEEDFTSMSENTLRVLNAMPDDVREEYQDFIDHAGLGEEGQEALNKRLTSMSALFNRGKSGTGADGASVGQEQSQRIMAQVLFNRMKQFQTKGGMFGWGRQVDMSKANFNDMPDSMEVALALGELDSRPSTRFDYDFRQLSRMVPTLASDFGSASPEDQAGFLSVVENDPQKYSFLFAETPSGFSIYEYLLDEVQRPEQPPEAEDQVTTAEETLAETSRVTSEGRPVYENNLGENVSERTITVTDERINGGKPTNIPTVYDGKFLGQEDAIQRVVDSGGTDPITGRMLDPYDSIEEAEAAARERSASIRVVEGSTEPPTFPEGPAPQERLGSFFDDFMGARSEMLEEIEGRNPRRKPEEEPPTEEPTEENLRTSIETLSPEDLQDRISELEDMLSDPEKLSMAAGARREIDKRRGVKSDNMVGGGSSLRFRREKESELGVLRSQLNSLQERD